jgi:membrane protease YdiL (CAAX protease family)
MTTITTKTKENRPSETSTQNIVKSKPKQGSNWTPLLAALTVIGAYFGASVVGELILYVYGIFRGWSIKQFEDWATGSVLAQFVNTLLIYGLMAYAVYVVMRSFKMSLHSVGVVNLRWRDPLIALLGVPVYVLGYTVLVGAVKALVPSLDINQQQQLGFQPSHEPIEILLTFVSLVLLPPLIEEFIMRGFLFTALLKRMRFIFAAILTSIVFASAHLQFGSNAPLLWVAAIDTFMLSLVLCFMRYKTGSLWPGIMLHMLKNYVAFMTIFVFHFS